MSRKSFVVIFLAIWFCVTGYLAFSKYQQAQNAYPAFKQSQRNLDKASTKSVNLINDVGKGTIYLAPKGATERKDGSADAIMTILKKTFIYKSPEQFRDQAEYVQPRVAGEFYRYWFKGGIQSNYEYAKEEANGREYRRFCDRITLVKFEQNHYQALVKTGIAIGGANSNEIQPKTFCLDITWVAKSGKWKFDRIKDVLNVNADDDQNSDDN